VKTFKQFLEQQSHNAQELVDDFTYEMGYPLFRGMPFKVDSRIFDHPTSRQSKDSNPNVVLAFNSMIDAAFGIPNIRSHSIFCTGHEREAKYYGNTYKIAPIGDYKFIWSSKLKDSYSNEDKIWNALNDNLHKNARYGVSPKKLFTELAEQINDSEWVHNNHKDDIIKAVANDLYSNENMHEYGEKIEQFPKWLKLSLKETAEELYQQNDMEKAILSYNEILIYQSGGYAAVLHKEKAERKKEEDDTPF